MMTKQTTRTVDDFLRDCEQNWLPAEELPTVSVDEYLRRLEANWIPVDAPQEAAKRGTSFRDAVGVFDHDPLNIVRVYSGGAQPRLVARFTASRVSRTEDHEHRVIYLDIYTDPAPDDIADAHTDANPDRDAVPDLDAAPDVDGAPDADGDGDVDAGADANNPISRHRAARRAERAYFDNAARLAGLPRAPGACTFVWRDAPGAEGS